MNRNDYDVNEVFNNLMKKYPIYASMESYDRFEISSIETSDLLNSMRRCSSYKFDYRGYFFTHPEHGVIKLNFQPNGGIIYFVGDDY